MIICYDHFMLVQFAHVPIRQNDYSLELPYLGRPEANLGNPVQRCAQDVAQVVSMQPAGSSSLVLSLALIHPSAWNRNPANFAFWAFSEVRQESCNKYCN